MPSSSKTPSDSSMDLDYSFQFNLPIRGRPATEASMINTDCAIVDDEEEGIPLTALEELELFGPEPTKAADALAMPPPPRPLPRRKSLALATRGFRSTSGSTSSSTPKSASPPTPLGFLPVKHSITGPAYKRPPSYHAGNIDNSSPFGIKHEVERERVRRPSFKNASPAPFGNVMAPPPSPSPYERGRSSSRCSSHSRRGSDVSMRDVSRKRRPSLMSILSPPGALDPLAPLKTRKKARDRAAMPPPPPTSDGSRGRSSASRK